MKYLIYLFFIICLVNPLFSQSGWQQINSGTTVHIDGLSFIDSQTGWVSGYNELIKKTTDGGSSFITQSYYGGQTFYYLGINFINSQTGFAAGGHYTYGISEIYKTTNGGSNWTEIFYGSYGVLFGTFFLNMSTGWATGNTYILKTTNSGTSFTALNTGFSNIFFREIYFFDANTGFTVGTEGTILKSTNGGSNWQSIPSGTSQSLNSLFFINNQTGFITGYNGTILKTTNAGQNWISKNSGSNYWLEDCFFFDNTGWVVGGDFYNNISEILFTNNGGETWTKQIAPFNAWLAEVQFINPSTGYIVGRNGTILKTTNGGLSIPAMPVLISPPDSAVNQHTSPELKWNSVPAAANYKVQISAVSNFSIISDSSTTDSSRYIVPPGKLQNGYTYYWRVKAENSYGSSAWSDIRIFSTILYPLTPTLVFPQNNAGNLSLTPTFIWQTATGAMYYNIQISTVNNFTLVVDSVTVDSNAYTIPSGKLNSGFTYYWHVRGKNNVGYGQFSEVWSFSTSLLPGIPVLVSPTNGFIGTSTTPQLVWNQISGINNYQVQVSPMTNFSYLVDSAIITDNQYQVRNNVLNINFTYFWRVRANNSYGSGGWSNVWSFVPTFVGIKTVNSVIPVENKIYQNYPNPFNPATKITFDVSKAAKIKIAVYDILGKEVEILADGFYQAGKYETVFNGDKLQSGIYFLRYFSNEYSSVKKMLLVK